jgi:hypothetical protein
MLFKLAVDKSPFVLNDGLKAIKEFVCLSDRQFTAVALCADYQSPLRKLPEKQKREQAAIIAGWPMEGKRLDKNGRNFVDGQVKSMEKAIQKYRAIDYDEDKEALEKLNKQIENNIRAIAENKSEASFKETVLKNGQVITTKDKKLEYELIDKANKFARELPDLHEAKKKLQDILNLREEANITTYTSVDLEGEETDKGLSALDQFMLKKEKKKD